MKLDFLFLRIVVDGTLSEFTAKAGLIVGLKRQFRITLHEPVPPKRTQRATAMQVAMLAPRTPADKP